jgi:hypothetical protein
LNTVEHPEGGVVVRSRKHAAAMRAAVALESDHQAEGLNAASDDPPPIASGDGVIRRTIGADWLLRFPSRLVPPAVCGTNITHLSSVSYGSFDLIGLAMAVPHALQKQLLDVELPSSNSNLRHSA